MGDDLQRRCPLSECLLPLSCPQSVVRPTSELQADDSKTLEYFWDRARAGWQTFRSAGALVWALCGRVGGYKVTVRDMGTYSALFPYVALTLAGHATLHVHTVQLTLQ